MALVTEVVLPSSAPRSSMHPQTPFSRAVRFPGSTVGVYLALLDAFRHGIGLFLLAVSPVVVAGAVALAHRTDRESLPPALRRGTETVSLPCTSTSMAGRGEPEAVGQRCGRACQRVSIYGGGREGGSCMNNTPSTRSHVLSIVRND